MKKGGFRSFVPQFIPTGDQEPEARRTNSGEFTTHFTQMEHYNVWGKVSTKHYKLPFGYSHPFFHSSLRSWCVKRGNAKAAVNFLPSTKLIHVRVNCLQRHADAETWKIGCVTSAIKCYAGGFFRFFLSKLLSGNSGKYNRQSLSVCTSISYCLSVKHKSGVQSYSCDGKHSFPVHL